MKFSSALAIVVVFALAPLLMAADQAPRPKQAPAIPDRCSADCECKDCPGAGKCNCLPKFLDRSGWRPDWAKEYQPACFGGQCSMAPQAPQIFQQAAPQYAQQPYYGQQYYGGQMYYGGGSCGQSGESSVTQGRRGPIRNLIGRLFKGRSGSGGGGCCGQ